MRTAFSRNQHDASPLRRVACALLWSVALILLAGGVAAEREGHMDVVVIVNRQNATDSVSREFLRQVFLKQVTRWQDDETIRPVDLSVKSDTRKRFSERILERSVDAVKRYWQQRIFSGRDIPPPELANDEAVVGYVKEHPGAIGYVSPGVEVRATKVLVVH